MIIYRKKVNDIEVIFYQRENGEIPVKEFLLSLSVKLRAKAFRDIELLEKYGNALKEPYVKAIKGKVKKAMKTPRKELEQAVRYMLDYKRREKL